MNTLQRIAFSAKMSAVSAELRKEGKIIGFVPTMGALHEGHLSLITRARQECDVVVASIFVNPTQFNDPRDFERYPRTVDRDVELLAASGCDFVFVPETTAEIFPADYVFHEISFGDLESVMEGLHRPGHFRGVANVVFRLFEIVHPHKAYFGLKDYQQLMIVRKMVEMLGIDVEVAGIRTGRAESGLALSSRNELLTGEQKVIAAQLYEALSLARNSYGKESIVRIREKMADFFASRPDFQLEYFEIVDGNTLQPLHAEDNTARPMAFVAARLGNVRLIDNIFLKE